MKNFKTILIIFLLMLVVFMLGRQTTTATNNSSELYDVYESQATSSYVTSFRTLKGVDVEVYSHSGGYIYIAKYKESVSVSTR